MAEAWLHKRDTENTIQGTTSRVNIELIRDVVDLVIDGQYTKSGVEALDSIIHRLGINTNSIYQNLLSQGVDPNEIKKSQYNNDLMKYLRAWLLPSHGPQHQIYTHKGADYDYSKEDDGDGDFNAKEKNQSWIVKRQLLQNTHRENHDKNKPLIYCR